MNTELTSEILKASPPIGVVATGWLAEIPITPIVGIVTVLYIILQSAYLIWRWRRQSKRDAQEEAYTE